MSSLQITLSVYVRGIASCCSQSHTYLYMLAVVTPTKTSQGIVKTIFTRKLDMAF